MRNPLDLTGRRILVTGASDDSDIGRTLCVTLADLGARLVLAGRRADALERTRRLLDDPHRHAIAPVDLTELDAIPGWMKRMTESNDPLNGLVHSASVQGYSVLRQVTAAQFERYFTLNVGAALMLARGFHQKGVFASDGGSIVFIGSVAGLKGQKGRSLYAASKAALVSVAQSLALELADRQIRVNVIAPAIVQSAKAEQQFAMLPAEQNAALVAAHPLGYGTPQDVADAAAYLLGRSGRWITGVALPVDGGFVTA